MTENTQIDWKKREKSDPERWTQNGPGLESGGAGGSRILPLCKQVSRPWFEKSIKVIFVAISVSDSDDFDASSLVWKIHIMISVALSDSDDLDTGELVLAEKPLFTVPAEAHNSDLDQYLESAVQVPVFVFVTVFVSVFGEQLGGTDKY